LKRKNRLIYLIHSKLSQVQSNLYKDDLEDLITNCEIDFFSIDTTNFIDVQEYYQMIENIISLREKHDKQIGIIVELKGRKIKVEKFTKEKNIIHLKQGNTVKLVTHAKNSDSEKIVISFKELYKMLTPGDKIIINENKASLTVENIVEIHSEKSRTRNNSPDKLGKEQDSKKKCSIGTILTRKNLMFMNRRLNNKTCQHLITCKECQESQENAIKITLENNQEKLSEKQVKNEDNHKHNSGNIPRVKTSIEPDINMLLDKIENNDNNINRMQEINDIKMIEFEQDKFFEVDEEEMKNIENKKIDGFIQSVADFSEQKYNERISKEDYEGYIDKLKDISSIKSEEFNLNNSNTCMNNINNNMYNNFLPNPPAYKLLVNDIIRRKAKRPSEPIKRYEIICKIDYDCSITNNSFLYIPGNI